MNLRTAARTPRALIQGDLWTRQNYFFTSESVSEGHPDKVCDRISDEIVDLFFREGAKAGIDPYEIRVACETLATTNRVVIAGEVRGPDSARKRSRPRPARAIKDIGYEQDGFHWKRQVEILLHAQSADIAQGVDAAGNKDEGAGDQGIMFGYACRETPELMPAPIYYAHKILEVAGRAPQIRRGRRGKLGPDAKSQVTVNYAQRQAGRRHPDRALDPASRRKPDLGRRARIVEPYIRKTLPEGWIAPDDRLARQPDRQIRHRRS